METLRLSDIERKEMLEKERLELIECLRDMCQMININENVNLTLLKYNYIIMHWDLTDDELKTRLQTIDDIYKTRYIRWRRQRDATLQEKGIESSQILDRLSNLVCKGDIYEQLCNE